MKYQAVQVAGLLTFVFTAGVAGVSTPVAWATSSDGVYKLSSYSAPVQGAGNANGESTWAIQVDDTSAGHKQTITGFGGKLY